MKISTRDKILDISQNLARIGNWTADSYDSKKSLIGRFIEETQLGIDDLSDYQLDTDFRDLFERFKESFDKMKKEKIRSDNKDLWAEKALTWANILQHRSSVA